MNTPKPPTAAEKLEALRQKKEQFNARMNARIAEAQRVQDNRQRREDARYKIVFGACILLDLETHPDAGAGLEASLKRTVTPRDAELLRSRGWKV